MDEQLSCLDDTRLDAIASSQASSDALEQAFAHAADCEACADLLAIVARGKVDLRTTESALDAEDDLLGPLPGDTIGRFVVQRVVGRGGMGLVVAASDPKLDRTVAIKILRPGLAAGALLREARAIATVRHPNVVTVHEVDSDAERVFLVMDLVDGPTLRGWLAERDPTWMLTVRTFIGAGRGLAAAHRRGLVHRDFKPDNVLVDDSGVAQVIDFGLVTPSRDMPSAGGEGSSLRGGTPRYMAPECLAGGDAGPASDQYSFCVAVFEALLGAHPFGGREGRTRRARNDEIAVPPHRLPRRLIRVLTTGLRADPEQRHPTMDVALDELADVLRARKRNRGIAAGGAVVVAAITTVLWVEDVEERSRCRSLAEGEQLADVWDPQRAAAIEAMIDPQAWPRFELHVDAYARAWNQLRARICRGARTSEVSTFDRQIACLEGRRVSLQATLDILETGRAQRTPLEIIYGLPSLEGCLSDEGSDSANLGPQPDDDVERLRQGALSAEARAKSGLPKEAIEQLEPLVADAGALGHRPLQVEILEKLAAAQVLIRPEKALQSWREAYALAGSLGDERRLRHLEVVGVSHHLLAGDSERAEFLFSLAEARALEDDIALTRARALLTRIRGDLESAESAYRRIFEHTLRSPRSEGDLGGAYGDLAGVLVMQGRVDEGLDFMSRSVEELERAYGPTHRQTILARENRAVMLRMQGKTAEALAEVRALREIAGPLEQPSLARLLAALLREGGDPEAALPLDREVVAARLERLGERHPETLESQAAVGLDLLEAGRPQEAIDYLAEPAKRVRALPSDSRSLKVLVHLGWAYQDSGDLDGAARALGEAHARVQSLPDPGPDAIRISHGLGVALCELGRFEDAIDVLRPADAAAAALLEASPDAGMLRNSAYQTRFALAKALWGAGRRARALAVGQEAAQLVAGLPQDDPRRVESDRWLEERRP